MVAIPVLVSFSVLVSSAYVSCVDGSVRSCKKSLAFVPTVSVFHVFPVSVVKRDFKVEREPVTAVEVELYFPFQFAD